MTQALELYTADAITAYLQTINMTELAQATGVSSRTWMNYRSGQSSADNMPLRLVKALNGFYTREQLTNVPTNLILPPGVFEALRSRSQFHKPTRLSLVMMDYEMTFNTARRFADKERPETRCVFIGAEEFQFAKDIGVDIALAAAVGPAMGICLVFDDAALQSVNAGTQEALRANATAILDCPNDWFTLPTIPLRRFEDLGLTTADKDTFAFAKRYWLALLFESNVHNKHLYADFVDESPFVPTTRIASVLLGEATLEDINPILHPMVTTLQEAQNDVFSKLLGGDAA